jgi:hypothetical protein
VFLADVPYKHISPAFAARIAVCHGAINVRPKIMQFLFNLYGRNSSKGGGSVSWMLPGDNNFFRNIAIASTAKCKGLRSSAV